MYKINLNLYQEYKADLADEVTESGINVKKGRALNLIKFHLRGDTTMEQEINNIADGRQKLFKEFIQQTQDIVQ